ncbi:MAG: hypothetical protein WD046_08460 [Paracoccaceae bacterium]
MKYVFIPAAFALVAGCSTSDDPAAGGFFNGVSGLAGGGYQARVDERQADVDSEQARAAALAAQQSSVAAQTAAVGTQIDQLRDELTRLRIQIANQQAELRSAGVAIPAALTTRINAVVNASPSGANDAERLAKLQAAVANARALAADLARLSA